MHALDFRVMSSMAVLIDYPTPDLPAQARAVSDYLQSNSKIWQDLLEGFALHVSLTPFTQVEETYTQAFDMNPSCTLEIGWHLFGETYKRGSFLANMRASLRANNVEEGTSLPDYLPNLLRLLPKLDPKDARGLVSDCILPSLAKIRSKLDHSPGLANRTGSEGNGPEGARATDGPSQNATPYDLLLESLDLMLQELAPLPAVSEHHACECGGGHHHADGHTHSHAHVNGTEVNHAG